MCSQNDDPTQHDLPKVDTPWAAKVHPDRLLRKVQGRQQAEAFEDMLRIDSKTLIDYDEGAYIARRAAKQQAARPAPKKGLFN